MKFTVTNLENKADNLDVVLFKKFPVGTDNIIDKETGRKYIVAKHIKNDIGRYQKFLYIVPEEYKDDLKSAVRKSNGLRINALHLLRDYNFELNESKKYNSMEAISKDVENDKLTIEQAAKEIKNSGFTNYVPDNEEAEGFLGLDPYSQAQKRVKEALHVKKDDTAIWRNVRDSLVAANLNLNKEQLEALADRIIDGLHNIADNKEADDLESDIKALDAQIKGK